ncbi:MAG: YciI family protein [Gaiellaceae bacterium]
MKFMLMIVTDEPAERALPPSEIDKIIAQHIAVGRELRATGRWVGSGRLRFSEEATTIRVQDGKHVALDGPFAETKEQIGGFYLIEADSQEAAIEWAKKLPLRDVGAIEVRPARTGARWRGDLGRAPHFLVMFIANANKPLSKAEVFRAIDSHYELSLDLAAQGKFVSSRALEPSPAAVTIRRKNGAHVVSDGPFAETKEFVAGYFVIACDSKAEAI